MTTMMVLHEDEIKRRLSRDYNLSDGVKIDPQNINIYISSVTGKAVAEWSVKDETRRKDIKYSKNLNDF